MGRSRRRNRHGIPDSNPGFEVIVGAAPVNETLAPTFISMPPAFVLGIDGFGPDDFIPGPPLATEELTDSDFAIPDSDDPSQLELSPTSMVEEDLLPAPGVGAISVSTLERPLLVLEAEPFTEERRETPRAPDAPPPAILPAIDQIEMALPDAEDPGIATAVAETELVETPEIPFELTEATVAATPAAEAAESEFGPEAIAALEPVVDPIELRCDEARAAADDGRLLDARGLYREIVTERPTHLAARNALAQLLERMGDNTGALVEYDRALDIDGSHATLLANRGALLGAMGRYAAAERDLKKVLRVEPAHLEALFNLGVVMTRKGLWSEAVSQLRRVVEIDPSRGAAYFYLGEALNKTDDLYGARAAYQRAAELMPGHSRALYGLGIVYDRLGRPDDAARMYRRSRDIGRR